MAKRKTYETDHYLYLTSQLLKTIQGTPTLKPENWNLEGSQPDDCELKYISSEHEHLFYFFEEFDCRTIKLINLRKPACRLSFFKTHRYFLKKAEKITQLTKLETIQDVITKLKEDINKLNVQTLFDQPTIKQKAIQNELLQWEAIAKEPDRYEIAMSNYHKEYYYNTLNYKYFLNDKTSDVKLANETVHLLKNQYEKNKDNPGIGQTRYNVIFIDLKTISEPDPYQNKVIHLYLEQFPIKTDMFLHHVYVREISEISPQQDTVTP